MVFIFHWIQSFKHVTFFTLNINIYDMPEVIIFAAIKTDTENFQISTSKRVREFIVFENTSRVVCKQRSMEAPGRYPSLGAQPPPPRGGRAWVPTAPRLLHCSSSSQRPCLSNTLLLPGWAPRVPRSPHARTTLSWASETLGAPDPGWKCIPFGAREPSLICNPHKPVGLLVGLDAGSSLPVHYLLLVFICCCSAARPQNLP